MTNMILFCNFMIIITMMLISSQLGNRLWLQFNSKEHSYIFPEGEELNSEEFTFKSMMSFFLILNVLIPLDLAVIVIVSKLFFTYIVSSDTEMISEEVSIRENMVVGCDVKNLEMHEDLVKVKHIFCDKTGTLTKNQLVFDSFAFGEHIFSTSKELDDRYSTIKNALEKFPQKDSEEFKDFWRCICLCHEVTQISLLGEYDPVTKKEVTVLSGASQDEICFLDMAKSIGYGSFIERSENSLKIMIGGKEENYEILKEIEFTSDRKRMSVIVKDKETGRVVNFIKGADVSIIPRLSKSEENEGKIQTMDQFAAQGLRTLMFGLKDLDAGFDRKNMTEDDIVAVEQEIKLIGVTGLEDILQDDVKRCIQDFRKADIKVWMISGDKGETAQTVSI